MEKVNVTIMELKEKTEESNYRLHEEGPKEVLEVLEIVTGTDVPPDHPSQPTSKLGRRLGMGELLKIAGNREGEETLMPISVVRDALEVERLEPKPLVTRADELRDLVTRGKASAESRAANVTANV